MSKGLGKVERLILAEFSLSTSYGGYRTINGLSIAVAGLKGCGVLSLPCNLPVWQSTARAVRSLVRKGLVVEGGAAGGSKLYKLKA